MKIPRYYSYYRDWDNKLFKVIFHLDQNDFKLLDHRHGAGNVTDTCFDIFLPNERIVLPQIEWQEWFCQKYPAHIIRIVNLAEGLRNRYSHLLMAGKFGVFDENI